MLLDLLVSVPATRLMLSSRLSLIPSRFSPSSHHGCPGLPDTSDDSWQSACSNWPKDAQKQFSSIGLQYCYPSAAAYVGSINGLDFWKTLVEKEQHEWDQLRESPRTAPFKGSSVVYSSSLVWLPWQEFRLIPVIPFYVLVTSLSVSNFRALLQFRLGSHALPIEQGRLLGPSSTIIRSIALAVVRVPLVMNVFACPWFAGRQPMPEGHMY